MATRKLTSAEKAQILAGTDLEIELGEAAPAAGAATVPVTPPILVTPAAPAVAAQTPAAPAAPSADLVANLMAQISSKDTLLVEVGVKLAQAEAKAAEGVESLPGLLAIAQTVIGSMQIALGGSDTSKALDAKDAVAEHAKLAPVYTEKFKVGGIAVPAAAVDDAKQPHPAFAQRLAALSANRK